MQSFEAKGLAAYSVEVRSDEVRAEVRVVPGEPGLEYLEIALSSDAPRVMPEVWVRWEFPHEDIHGLWRPDRADAPHPCMWDAFRKTEATISAPVTCWYSAAGLNRWTVACSDAINQVGFRGALREEDGMWQCDVRLFEAPDGPQTAARVLFRVDTRPVRYEEALAGVARWWDAMPEYGHRPVPDYCRMPTYSTWYSFHQLPDAKSVELQAELSRQCGCESLILDDGWQMEDSARSYAFCGDWEICEKIFPDMAAHVRRVHELGMAYMVWFAVPFVGKYTRAWERFRGMYLPTSGEPNTRALDPRYPAVREYLIETYIRAVREWDIDGFKLDFIDIFRQPAQEDPEALPGRDFDSVGEASACLLEEMQRRLSEIKPDLAFEFRQTYIGPRMRRYATMFRAGDCPGDFRQNKVRTVNLRLLSMETMVHSDMLMWHPQDSACRVAMQLQHVLFSVPQISMRFEELSPEHRQALTFWLSFWRQHRLLLLDGLLRAQHPELGYTLVSAEKDDEYVAVSYSENCLDLPAGKRRLYLVNTTYTPRLVCRTDAALSLRAVVRDCLGNVTADLRLSPSGLFELPVPPAGLAELTLA